MAHMARAGPTATPPARLAERYIITVGTQAPLSTVWQEPASCPTAIPTISAGFCNTRSCSAYPASSVANILSAYGASVNYPDFTTSQSQTSTSCMPSGYANLKWFYFTAGSQCPSNWVTATTAVDPTFATIVCCPTGYPTPILVKGQSNFDCQTVSAIPAGAPFVLAAQGNIATTQAGTAAYVPFWVSQSVIATTSWPTPTSATIYHPGVNFLVDAPSSARASATATGSSSSDGSSAGAFTLFHLGMGASIGVLVVIAIGGLVALACLIGCIKCLIGGKRRQPPAVNAYYPPPQGPPAMGQYGYGAPPQGQYPPPGQYGAPPPVYYTKGAETSSHPV